MKRDFEHAVGEGDSPCLHPHPGQILRAIYVDRFGFSVSQVAEAVGVSRKNFSQLLNGHFAVSPEMAVRLARAFGTSPQMWLMLQMEYDLEAAERKLRHTTIQKLV